MKKPLLAFVLLGVVFNGNSPVGLPAQQSDHATVSGLVQDVNGAFVTNADLDLDAAHTTYRVQTKSRGTYSIELPPGMYSMEIKHYGFCGMRRSEFILKPYAVVHFQTDLRVCPSDSVNSKFSYEDLAAVPNSSLRPLILYGEKTPKGSGWKYTGPVLEAIGTYPVVFTYNLLTITADSLIYDPKAQSVAASGHVAFQDGKTVQKGSSFEVTLSGSYPTGKLTEEKAAVR